MPVRALMIEIFLLDGRYHGTVDWPPSPFRLFQALVAGAYGGRWRSEPAADKDAVFRWLERLDPPLVAGPVKRDARSITSFVPNNDLDAVGGDPRRVSEIRAGKTMRAALFDQRRSILYAWPFDEGEECATRLCRLAERLHTLGRGVDAAFAHAEICDWGEAESRLAGRGGKIARPGPLGGTQAPTCPAEGSLDSLKTRHDASAARFEVRREGPNRVTLFRQPSKPHFRTVVYDRAPDRILFDLRQAGDPARFRAVAQECATDMAIAVRDLTARRLTTELAGRAVEIERVVVGRGAQAEDIARRVRFVPLPSIGTEYTDAAIRRVLVELPPACPVSVAEMSWALAGQLLERVAPDTGEVLPLLPEDTLLTPAEDEGMLRHYGIGLSARRWQSVTPVALPQGRRRGRLDGVERAEDERRAAAAVAEALRHAGRDWRGVDIRVQAEPLLRKGARAGAFRPNRFAGCLRHVEVTFAEPIAGLLLIGDGRWLGLGVMAPVREDAPAVHIFAIAPDERPPLSAGKALAVALRRAVMARADAEWRRERHGRNQPPGRRELLPTFFTGHEPEGGRAHSGKHEHLFFLAEDSDGDGRIDRLAVVSPHLADRAVDLDRHREMKGHLRLLDSALANFTILRAGRAGLLHLAHAPAPGEGDPTFGRARVWLSRTRYLLTRHPHGDSAEDAVRSDLVEECDRRGLPRPEVEVIDAKMGPQGGISARVRLCFRTAVDGPLLLGRGSHQGAGSFHF